MDSHQLIFNQPASVIWLVVGFLFLALGTMVGEPVVASLGFAALITAVAAITVPSVSTQLIIWGVLSVSLAIVLRGLVPRQATDLVPDREATVSDAIPKGGVGLVSYEGAFWKARCQISDIAIAAGQTVQVVERHGLTLIVLPSSFPEGYIDQ